MHILTIPIHFASIYYITEIEDFDDCFIDFKVVVIIINSI